MLLGLIAFATPSSGQSSSDCPCLGKVCFELGEAEAIHDSLWMRLSERERRVIAHQMLMNQQQARASAEREAKQATEQMQAAMRSSAVYKEDWEEEKQARQELMLKTKGRGARGFLIGLGLGVGATIAAVVAL